MAIEWMCLRRQYGGANDVVDLPGGGQFQNPGLVGVAASCCTLCCTWVENREIAVFARQNDY